MVSLFRHRAVQVAVGEEERVVRPRERQRAGIERVVQHLAPGAEAGLHHPEQEVLLVHGHRGRLVQGEPHHRGVHGRGRHEGGGGHAAHDLHLRQHPREDRERAHLARRGGQTLRNLLPHPLAHAVAPGHRGWHDTIAGRGMQADRRGQALRAIPLRAATRRDEPRALSCRSSL